MRVLITGASGFLGKNLIDRLSIMPEIEVMAYHHTDSIEALRESCSKADFVFHLAAVCRPKDSRQFKTVNVGFLQMLLDCLSETNNLCPVLLTSSKQAALEGRFAGSEYGQSKRMAEELLMSYGQRTGAKVMYYRLPHVFGKWGTPNYNNVVHTFCHNIANGLPIRVDNPGVELELLWIEDLIDDMIRIMQDGKQEGHLSLPITYCCTLGRLAEVLSEIHIVKAGVKNDFEKKLSLTLQSY